MTDAQIYLLQIRKLDKLAENKRIELRQLQELMDIATGTTANWGGERVQSSGNQQKMACAVEKYVDVERKIYQRLDDIAREKLEIISTIEQLPLIEYDILHKLYVQGLSFDDIAAAYSRSKSWATSVHGRALKSVDRIISNRGTTA